MRGLQSIPRPLLLTFAILFSLSLVIYTAVWIYYAGWTPPAQIGIEWEPQLTPYRTIKRVSPGGPADRAGLCAQDRVLAVDGYPQHAMALALALARGKAGDVVSVLFQRPGVKDSISVQVTLKATATVLGLFETWECDIAEIFLEPGDILAICTDGVLEAANPAEQEFGEDGLVAILRANLHLSASALLDTVVTGVKQYAPGEQADDLTLLIAKSRIPNTKPSSG